jgi:hypothetical protein
LSQTPMQRGIEFHVAAPLPWAWIMYSPTEIGEFQRPVLTKQD